jgi:tetratricopeptide (TPR) repeat protein
MARTLSLEWLLLGRSDRDLLHEARRLASRAVQLDPLSAVGHRELGHASMYLGDLDESEEHFAVALDRAPHHADILADRADILVHGSRMGEAKQRIDEAIALNPLAPDDYRWISGSVEFFLENYDASLAQLRAMQDKSMVDRLMAAAAAMAGDMQAATFHRDQWLARYPDFRVKDFAAFMPHRSSADIDHFVAALSKAGFA